MQRGVEVPIVRRYTARMNCPKCGSETLVKGMGDPGYSKRAMGLFLVGALVSVAWIGLLLAWSPAFLVPRGIGGIAICAIVYLAPGLIVGLYASNLPKVRPMRCADCRWRGKV